MNTSSLLSIICVTLPSILFAGISTAAPSDDMLQSLNAQVLRVHVNHNNGSHGFGSAVVIAKNQVVTNCHVVTDARDVKVVVEGHLQVATEVKPDWRHDLCILTVDNLEAPVAKMGASKSLKHETPVFTIGYPDQTTKPVNTFGAVKEIFPLDDGVVIRASSSFRLGASGGGVFDDAGTLVGIITLKSRGNQAQYYYMPVEWVQALMDKPAQALGASVEKPFWAESAQQRPYFMRVVQPYITHDWQSLLSLAQQWVKSEPDTTESWFYLAVAEYETRDYNKAEEHFNKVLALSPYHDLVLEFLSKIAEKTASTQAASNQYALLSN